MDRTAARRNATLIVVVLMMSLAAFVAGAAFTLAADSCPDHATWQGSGG